MKRLFFTCVAVLFVAVFSACSTTYNNRSQTPETGSLPLGKNFIILNCEDGGFRQKTYVGSGATFTNVIASELSPFAGRIDFAQTDTLDKFYDPTTDYIIVPKIYHWEDHATNWSGIPDILKASVDVYDAHKNDNHGTPMRIAFLKIDATSQWATLRNRPPSAMLDEPLQEFFERIFSQKPKQKRQRK